MVSPWSQGSENLADWNSSEDQEGCNKRASPATTQIIDLADGLGEDDLIRVTLKVAQDRGAKNGCHNDRAEEAELHVEELRKEGTVAQNLAGAH